MLEGEGSRSAAGVMDMSRWVSLIALALISFIWVAGAEAQADAKSRVIITFRDAPMASDVLKVSEAGGKVTRSFNIVPSVAAELPASAIERLRADPRVLAVEQDHRVQLLDAELDNSWGVKRIGAGLVHPTNQGAGVKVAVIDTGIDYTHPDLDANYVAGYDFVNGDSDPMDDQGHGTMVSGTIAAEDNGSGVVGVAPQARLYVLKVLGSDGSGWESDVIAGVDWARTHGIQVVNMSLGSSSASYAFQTAITNASNAGLVLVAAAGNSGNCSGTGDNVSYPARFSQVIAVAATDSSDARACFSSTGSTAEIAAPGVSTTMPSRGGGYASASGTSFASPHVAGVAALVIASGVSGNSAVRQRLQTTADDLGTAGRDTRYGYGLVDADEAAGGGSPPSTHDVAVTSVSAPGSVTQGSTASVGVTVANQGTVSETFDVTLRDGASTIDSSSVSLAAGASTTVSFSWNTTGVATGAHTLTATAGPVSGETDTADNSRTASVTVNEGSSGSLSLQVTMSGRPRPGQYAYFNVRVTNNGRPVSRATVDVVLDTQGRDQTGRKLTSTAGSATFSFGTRYNDRLPWVVQVTASSGGLSGSKTCTYNGVRLSCS
jgi:subtilisin family serine protease